MSRNLLDKETSPYLLQHRTNPVHWRAWNEDSLAEARAGNIPILLSVGYAACHWCHVMAHESFEDATLAEQINAHFIPIKVDREERPDLDAIYQRALSLLGQPGGWPLTMFLMPTGEPFFGGTYFPKSPAYGRPGFAQVLAAIDQAWKESPDQVTSSARALMDGLSAHQAGDTVLSFDLHLLDAVARTLHHALDPVHGGFRGAPKFPQIPALSLILHASLRQNEPALADGVTHSLDHMCQGGLYDHLGGGFARYSTDDRWFAPHFEKMLYDNAQFIEILSLAWQLTGSPLYANRVSQTVDWLKREMTTDTNAFAATLDADSDGAEGRFYVWSEAEIDAALTPDQATLIKRTYGVLPGGNWEDGRSILHRNHSHGGEPDDPALVDALTRLLATRNHRPAPARDDKVLADWNGMIIAALAQAGLAFSRPDWISLAASAFDAICGHLSHPSNRLGHSWRLGQRRDEAMLDDYAQMARAALCLFEATGDQHLIDRAESWVSALDDHYWDDKEGGYFFTADDADDLILRTKSAHDAATPSGNGIMVEVLARLFHMTGNDVYRRRAEAVCQTFAPLLQSDAAAMSSLLNGWELLSSGTTIILFGNPATPRYRELLSALARLALPTRVLFPVRPGHAFPADHPAYGKAGVNDAPTVYICRYGRCSLPLTDPDQLRELLP